MDGESWDNRFGALHKDGMDNKSESPPTKEVPTSLLHHLDWRNEPAKWNVATSDRMGRSSTGALVTKEKTDWWRRPEEKDADGCIMVRTIGHFGYVTVSGDFTATVKITGKYTTQYDQCGLMVRIDDETWMKCGIEFDNDVQNISAVVTRGVSDWSLAEVPNPEATWVRILRAGNVYTVQYKISEDQPDYTPIRDFVFPAAAEVEVGIMACSPSRGGFEAVFEEFDISAQPGEPERGTQQSLNIEKPEDRAQAEDGTSRNEPQQTPTRPTWSREGMAYCLVQ